MAYNHGIAVLENPTSVPTPAVNDGEVPVIFGTAPINLASDPRAATNKLFCVIHLQRHRLQSDIQMITRIIHCVRQWIHFSRCLK